MFPLPGGGAVMGHSTLEGSVTLNQVRTDDNYNLLSKINDDNDMALNYGIDSCNYYDPRQVNV